MHRDHIDALARRVEPAEHLWLEHGFHLGRTGTLMLVGAVLLAGLAAKLIGG